MLTFLCLAGLFAAFTAFTAFTAFEAGSRWRPCQHGWEINS